MKEVPKINESTKRKYMAEVGLINNNNTNKKDELVQYFIINSELNMSPGKVAAQVAHVAIIITFDHINEELNPDYYFDWLNLYDQKKIILRGKQKDLEKLIAQRFYYIKDKGYNEVPEGSLTCVGLPPMKRSEAQNYVKRLQLY